MLDANLIDLAATSCEAGAPRVRAELDGHRLLWTPAAQNRKTGRVPTAYVGETRSDTWASCEGCDLRESTCYAWHGTQARFGLPKIHAGFAREPQRYTLARALKRRLADARIARVTAIGDPLRANRAELLASLHLIRRAGLGVVGYTHFWRDEDGEALKRELMASCDTPAQADEAIAAGWRATSVLPWGHVEAHGPLFVTPAGHRGVVCPAQRLERVTCNDCRMCDPQHRVWRAGKVHAIGFLDHSPTARGEARRAGRRLPTAGAGNRGATGWEATRGRAPAGAGV